MPLAVMPVHICLYRRTRQSPYGRLRNGVPDAQKSCGKPLLSAVLMLIILNENVENIFIRHLQKRMTPRAKPEKYAVQ